jgi:hypothetical protein
VDLVLQEHDTYQMLKKTNAAPVQQSHLGNV